MRVDDTTVLDPDDLVESGMFTHELETGPGRNSVRIKSISTHTMHVVVANINYMPQVSNIGHKEFLFSSSSAS